MTKVNANTRRHRKPLVKQEHGVWVYQGEPTTVSLVDLIDEFRGKRSLENFRMMRGLPQRPAPR